jgi:hypothetical protein
MGNRRTYRCVCNSCDRTFFGTTKTRKYCSVPCRNDGYRRPRPAKEHLAALMQEHRFGERPNFSKIGRIFGVNCRTVMRWAELYELNYISG